MTRNEKQRLKALLHRDCEKVGNYLCLDDELVFDNTPTGHWLAHLLIERMVGDGWEVSMVHDRSGIVMCAHKDKTKNLINFIEHQVDEAADFPTAVVELFCRVYAIPDGE